MFALDGPAVRGGRCHDGPSEEDDGQSEDDKRLENTSEVAAGGDPVELVVGGDPVKGSCKLLSMKNDEVAA